MEGEALDRVDATGAVTRVEPLDNTVPRNTFSALLSHRFDSRWTGSLAVYHLDEMRWRGEGSEVDDYTRVDLKLAHRLPLGPGRAEVALIVHNLTDEVYNEFRIPEETARDGNFFDRRAYLQLSLEFD
jgi:outer membrane receptor protein involved in Fe transport